MKRVGPQRRQCRVADLSIDTEVELVLPSTPDMNLGSSLCFSFANDKMGLSAIVNYLIQLLYKFTELICLSTQRPKCNEYYISISYNYKIFLH